MSDLAAKLIGDFSIGEAIFDKTKYRTKFEVHFVEWNPRMDLLALASMRGNVIVKRLYWKTGWKVDFSKENFLVRWRSLFCSSLPFAPISANQSSLIPKASSNQVYFPLKALCWSPDGQVLLVAFQNGNFYYLNAQNGRPVYFINFKHTPDRIMWFEVMPADQLEFKNNVSVKISSTDFNFIENAPVEHEQLLTDVEHFLYVSLPRSLFGSLLCVSYATTLLGEDEESFFVDVLSCAFVCVKRFNITKALIELYTGRENEVFTSTLEILNICMLKNENVFNILCKYCAKKDETSLLLYDNNDEDTSLFAYKTSVFSFPFDFSDKSITIYSNFAWIMCQMSYCTAYINEMFSFLTFDWMAESEAFHRRLLFNVRYSTDCTNPEMYNFLSQDLFTLCRDFLITITTGIIPQSIHNFLINDSALKDLKSAITFVDVNFGSLIAGISVGLRPALYLFKLHLCSLQETLIELFKDEKKENNPFSFLFTDDDSMDFDLVVKTEFNRNVFDSTFKRLNLDLTRLDECLVCLLDVAEDNRENLKHFVRFLMTLYANHTEDPHSAEIVELKKTFETHKINFHSLCNFFARKFGNQNVNWKEEERWQSVFLNSDSKKEKDKISSRAFEFNFLETYFNRIKPKNIFSSENNKENCEMFCTAMDVEVAEDEMVTRTIVQNPLDDVFKILDDRICDSDDTKRPSADLLSKFLQLTSNGDDKENAEAKSNYNRFGLIKALNDCTLNFRHLFANGVNTFV